jgi:hypothetical protein
MNYEPHADRPVQPELPPKLCRWCQQPMDDGDVHAMHEACEDQATSGVVR